MVSTKFVKTIVLCSSFRLYSLVHPVLMCEFGLHIRTNLYLYNLYALYILHLSHGDPLYITEKVNKNFSSAAFAALHP